MDLITKEANSSLRLSQIPWMRDVLDSQKFISWKSLLALLHSDASRGVLLEYTQTLLCTVYLSLFEIDHTMPFARVFQLGE